MGRKKGVAEFEESPPDDFDPSNPYKDPVAMLEMREHIVREKWIAIEKAKILRERLRWCYRVEGVNHHQKCRHLVEQYLESTRGIGWGKDHRPHSFHGLTPLSLSIPPIFVVWDFEILISCGLFRFLELNFPGFVFSFLD
ncbi:unnamed protein product [Linum tenue]|uniref:NADH dehydrogenase [ubiquinone] 1 beta subcomplex subunit 10-B n=1 Tax=Linum tenue TaxID=586396 RepID=A0AAV0J884_9ROSI|nr:unnamed protein product [Linum tenue]